MALPPTLEDPEQPPGDPPPTVDATTVGGGSETLGAGGPEPPSALPGLPERYTVLARIGVGGGGEVYRVRDDVLDREIAMKVLRRGLHRRDKALRRFIQEARTVARLQHPGIVPIIERGELADGRPWFTMKEVRGRTFGEVIADLHAGRGDGTLRRLIDALARVCQAVGFGHGRGVVHRDLKPANLMVGEFGEVVVMDWGLAGDVDPESTEVVGTPAYMSPELAAGRGSSLRSDVYSLGAVLYEVLSGRAPFRGSPRAVLRAVLAGPPAPLVPGPDFQFATPPADLRRLCERAMAREVHERHRDAAHLADDLVRWLDGAERRDRAQRALAEAADIALRIGELAAEEAELRARAHELLGPLRSFDPVHVKEPGWAFEDRADALRADAGRLDTVWTERVQAALRLAPELEAAHDALADRYRDKLLAAEAAGDPSAAARYEILLRAHARGRYEDVLAGTGRFSLVTEPAGATVTIDRFEIRGRRLRRVSVGISATTPVEARVMPAGSYLMRVEAPGCATIQVPAMVRRGAHWRGDRPGSEGPTRLRLPRPDELGPADVFVAGGWFSSGGDAAALQSLPAREVWVDSFVVRRFPVTCAEFLGFLNALVDAGRVDAASAAAPRLPLSKSGGADVASIAWARDGSGRFLPEWVEAEDWDPDRPAILVDWLGARAYASWEAERTGLPWRLPNELEWEKAARGVDGRRCPWGDFLEPTWARVVGSSDGPAGPAPVDSYPIDESPYGARGMGGNVRDWCGNHWLPDGPPVEAGLLVHEEAEDDDRHRAVRGGAWTAVIQSSRSAARFGDRPTDRFMSFGVRLVRSVE